MPMEISNKDDMAITRHIMNNTAEVQKNSEQQA